MTANGIFDSTTQVLDKALDLRSRKLEVISANIANAETPGYARLRMDFEEALKESVSQTGSGSGTGQRTTHPRHMTTGGGGAIQEVRGHFYRQMDQNGIGDNNNVSLEREMVDLSENQIRYEAGIRMLGKKFNMLKLVIQERV